MNKKSIFSVIILFLIFSITIGFSAFASEMSISKIVADVRIEKNVRITGVEILYDRSNDITLNNLDYDVDSVLSNVSFNSTSSYVVYKVTITNFGNARAGVYNVNFGSGYVYDVLDSAYGSMICDASNKCNLGASTDVIFKVYPSSHSIGNHVVDFDFDIRQYYDITYQNVSGSYADTVIGGEGLYVYFSSPKPTGVKLYCDGELIDSSKYSYRNGDLEYQGVWGNILVEAQYEYSYEYMGNSQEFIAPVSGIYRVELWGASGVYKSDVHDETVGKGGYVAGNISLKKNDKFYIYVGSNNGSQFNGAGHGEALGGGATDVRLVSGSWDDFESLKSRIIVAGAGGGGVIKSYSTTTYTYEGNSPGHGGGLNGYDASFSPAGVGYSFSGHGATQTAGGSPGAYSGIYDITDETYGKFGQGGYKIYNRVFSASGGGGGYYGGGHGVHPGSSWPGAGGGSSFISGHNGCNAIDELSVSENIIHTNQSVHYSGYVFTDTLMIDGAGYQWTTSKGTYAGMPSWDGSTTMGGNAAAGYAKIYLVG